DIVYKVWQNPRIAVYEKGVTRTTRNGEQQWRWNEFSAMSGFLLDHKVYGLTAMKSSEWKFEAETRKDNLTITPMYKQATALCELCIAQLRPVLTPKFKAALDRGEPQAFGKIMLTSDFFSDPQHSMIRWQDIERIQQQGQSLQMMHLGTRQPISL